MPSLKVLFGVFLVVSITAFMFVAFTNDQGFSVTQIQPKNTMKSQPKNTVEENAMSIHIMKTNSFVRAAIIYLPSENNGDRFAAQFRWFRRSWIEMQKHEPQHWRTDILVVTDGKIPLLTELNCTKDGRTSRDEPNKCIVLDNYVKAKSKEFDYGYADSINCLTVDSPLIDDYDWLLRTDIDTFLTPSFAVWKPEKMAVGQGGYCFDDHKTCARLERISQDLNLKMPNVTNIGSTWYGPAKIIKECARLSMKVIKHLHKHEFTTKEKSKEYGISGWPEWHYGVLTMYGGHLAINHCAVDFGFEKRSDMLDFPSSSDESPSKHAHLHTWQNSNRFSKFVFEAGGYANETKETLNLDKISDYAMYMALDSVAKTKIPL